MNRAGSNRRLLLHSNISSGGGRQLSSLALGTNVEQADSVRQLVVGFMGRSLTREEDNLLQQECAKNRRLQNQNTTTTTTTSIDKTDARQDIAQCVVQALMTSFFLQKAATRNENGSMNDSMHNNDDDCVIMDQHHNNNNHDAEFAQVETMAAHTIQAWTRGFLCRRQHQQIRSVVQEGTPKIMLADQTATANSRRKKKRLSCLSAAKESQTVMLPAFRRVLSTASQRRASNLGHVLDDIEMSIENMAVVIIQALARGYFVRAKKDHPVISIISVDADTADTVSVPAIATPAPDEREQTMAKGIPTTEQNIVPTQPITQQPTTQAPTPQPASIPSPTQIPQQQTTQATPQSTAELLKKDHQRDDSILQAIPEKETATQGVIDKKDSKSMDLHSSSHHGKTDLRQNLLGMQYLNESQSQLKSITSTVKQAILVKLQALARGFLVRRPRHRMRKARSVRALLSRRNLFAYQGTTEEQGAATAIQRTIRGYVQRWKYWTAMRQQQLDDIIRLKKKQLRKIGERKKSVLKSCRKQISFDATSLARQLQRAKRAIKFLVKQEQRQITQNDKLSAEVVNLTKTNKFLENSVESASNSTDTLQVEIATLAQGEARLQSTRSNHQESLQQLTVEWNQLNTKAEEEKEGKQQIQSCIDKIKERAQPFLLDHPLPEILEADSSTQSQLQKVGAS